MQGEAVVFGAHHHERLLVAHAQGVRVRARVAFVQHVVRRGEMVYLEVSDLQQGRPVHVEQFQDVVVLQVERLHVFHQRAGGVDEVGVVGEGMVVHLLRDVLAKIRLVGSQAVVAGTDPRVGHLGAHASRKVRVGPVVQKVQLRVQDAVPKRVVFLHRPDDLQVTGVIEASDAFGAVHGIPPCANANEHEGYYRMKVVDKEYRFEKSLDERSLPASGPRKASDTFQGRRPFGLDACGAHLDDAGWGFDHGIRRSPAEKLLAQGRTVQLRDRSSLPASDLSDGVFRYRVEGADAQGGAGEVRLLAYLGEGPCLHVPAAIDGKPVVSLAFDLFRDLPPLERVSVDAESAYFSTDGVGAVLEGRRVPGAPGGAARGLCRGARMHGDRGARVRFRAAAARGAPSRHAARDRAAGVREVAACGAGSSRVRGGHRRKGLLPLRAVAAGDVRLRARLRVRRGGRAGVRVFRRGARGARRRRSSVWARAPSTRRLRRRTWGKGP